LAKGLKEPLGGQAVREVRKIGDSPSSNFTLSANPRLGEKIKEMGQSQKKKNKSALGRATPKLSLEVKNQRPPLCNGSGSRASALGRKGREARP